MSIKRSLYLRPKWYQLFWSLSRSPDGNATRVTSVRYCCTRRTLYVCTVLPGSTVLLYAPPTDYVLLYVCKWFGLLVRTYLWRIPGICYLVLYIPVRYTKRELLLFFPNQAVEGWPTPQDCPDSRGVEPRAHLLNWLLIHVIVLERRQGGGWSTASRCPFLPKTLPLFALAATRDGLLCLARHPARMQVRCSLVSAADGDVLHATTL